MNTKYSTQVNVWASTCRNTPDNIIFGRKTISKYSIPKIPNKLYIGQAILKNPKIISTYPNNLQTGVNRTETITIKFNELTKPSTYFNSITIKNLNTSKTVPITNTIKGNTLVIKSTITLNANTWYQVTIPASSLRNYAGNNLIATDTFKFRIGN